MAYIQNNTNITNITVSGDLDGPLTSPKVKSIENVTRGVLSLANGGLGISSFPYGKIPIGDSNNQIDFIYGKNDEEVLTWSESLSTWTTKRFQGITDFVINLGNNPFFEINGSFTTGSIKYYNITPKILPPNMFYSSGDNGGYGEFRNLSSSDIPDELINKTLTNSRLVNVVAENLISSGSYSGDFKGTFTGETFGYFDGQATGIFSGLHNGTFIGVLSGDGSKITNLNADALSNLDTKLEDSLGSISNLKLKEVYIERLSTSEFNSNFGNYRGNFYGDGANLKNLKTSNIDNFKFDVLSLFKSGKDIKINDGIIESDFKFDITVDKNFSINKDNQNFVLNLNSVIDVSNINSNIIKTNDLYATGKIEVNSINAKEFNGLFSGDGSKLYNIGNDSLKAPYIFINGSKVFLGQNYLIEQFDLELGNNLIGNKENNILSLDLNENINVNTINANESLSINNRSSFFYGNGNNITNINPLNIIGLDDYIKSRIIQNPVDNTNIKIINNNISLNQDIYNLNSIQSNTLNTTTLNTNTLNASSLNVNNISASQFFGNGGNIKNIQISNINGLSQYLNTYFVPGNYISINNGVISANIPTGSVYGINTTGNVSHTNNNGIFTISLNSNITLGSIVAITSISSSQYFGNGANLRNINYLSLSNTPNLSIYALTSSLNSLSSSINTKFNNYVLLTQTSSFATVSSLSSYLLASTATSTYSTISSVNSLSSSFDTRISNISFNTSSFVLTSSYNAFSSSTSASITQLYGLVNEISYSNQQNFSNIPYDIGGEIEGCIPSGSKMMSYVSPRTFMMQEFLQYTGSGYANGIVRLNGALVSYPVLVNKNDLITVYSTKTGSFAYFTIRGTV